MGPSEALDPLAEGESLYPECSFARVSTSKVNGCGTKACARECAVGVHPVKRCCTLGGVFEIYASRFHIVCNAHIQYSNKKPGVGVGVVPV